MRRIPAPRRLGIAVPGLLVLITACSAGGASGASLRAGTPASAIPSHSCVPPVPAQTIDRAVINPSLATLRGVASALVQIHAQQQGSVDYPIGPDPPYTVTTVVVDRVLAGQAPANLRVRQIGSLTACFDSAVTILQPGATYVAALAPWSFRPGEPTGEYGVAYEPVGLFRLDRGTVLRLDPETPTQIPAALPLAEFTAAYNAS